MPFESELESYCVLAKGDSKIFLTSIRTKGSTDSGEKTSALIQLLAVPANTQRLKVNVIMKLNTKKILSLL